ncbi:MAG: T9SS C-terminal target domain-containing protein, partial [Hymenobacter sp.]
MNLFYKLLTRQFYLFFLFACLLGSIPSRAQLPPKLWDRTLGGNGNDGLQQVWETADGGYIVSGTSYSGFSGDKTRTRDGLWILKLDASGTKQWDQAYGAGIVNSGASVQQTADGGYVLAGTVWAGITGDKTEPSRGSYDYWILRLDANGAKLWDRTYGGDDYDLLKSIRQLPDGGYLVGGYSYSGQTGDKSQPLR